MDISTWDLCLDKEVSRETFPASIWINVRIWISTFMIAKICTCIQLAFCCCCYYQCFLAIRGAPGPSLLNPSMTIYMYYTCSPPGFHKISSTTHQQMLRVRGVEEETHIIFPWQVHWDFYRLLWLLVAKAMCEFHRNWLPHHSWRWKIT